MSLKEFARIKTFCSRCNSDITDAGAIEDSSKQWMCVGCYKKTYDVEDVEIGQDVQSGDTV
jgi:hypothetical protein